MDIPLDKPRNTKWLRFRTHVLMILGIFALVFAIGALPVAFMYFAGDLPTPKDQNSNENSKAQFTQSQIIAFVNVNVVPMDSERVLSGQTVLTKDGLIVAIGPSQKVKVPSSALQVDGRGKYLMPGLADMHVHFEVFDERTNIAMMRLFVANGVTTVLNLFGTPVHLELREKVAKGELIGPRIYTSGPYISNAPAKPPTVEEAERAVLAQKQAGYDIIKIHGDFSREVYNKVFEIAHRENLRVIGHLPRNLGVTAAFEEHQDAIAHAEEYLYAYFFYKPSTGPADRTQEARLRWVADQAARIPSVAEATAKAGVWVSPTLTVYHGIGLQVSDIDSILKRPEAIYLPPLLASRFAPANNTYIQRFKKETAPVFLAQAELLSKLVKGLRDAGVKLIAGTDTPVPSVVPGFSLHDELREMTAAGLTPYEALRTATANAAEFMRTDKFGVIAEGKSADMILLDKNPLEDVSNAARRLGVMLRGRWLAETELKKMLEELARSNKGSGQ